MPLPYFDPDDPDHLTRLPATLRDHPDLAGLAERAEALVLASVTRPDAHDEATVLDAGTPAERYVWLRGFTVDPAQAIPALAGAIRLEVARAVRWLAAQDAKKANLDSEAAGDPMTSKHYRDDAEDALPPGGCLALAPFRVRSTATVI